MIRVFIFAVIIVLLFIMNRAEANEIYSHSNDDLIIELVRRDFCEYPSNSNERVCHPDYKYKEPVRYKHTTNFYPVSSDYQQSLYDRFLGWIEPPIVKQACHEMGWQQHCKKRGLD